MYLMLKLWSSAAVSPTHPEPPWLHFPCHTHSMHKAERAECAGTTESQTTLTPTGEER